MFARAFALFVVAAGCGEISPEVRGSSPTPSTIAIDGTPNGLWWNAGTRTLYIADDAGSRIIPWRDDSRAGAPIALPAEGRPGLGQIIQLADGALVVPRFGHRENGAIIVVDASGQARALPGIDAKHRRLGLAPAPDGGIFVAYFDNQGEDKIGEVAEVSLAGGGERDLASGLQKPVGMAVSGDWLYVSDQDANEIFRCPAAHCDKLVAVARVPTPDLLTAAPGGAVLAASRAGGVTAICPSGATHLVVPGPAPTRGLAYDAAGSRLFVVDYDQATKRSTLHTVVLTSREICDK